jgi:hypothetical protein
LKSHSCALLLIVAVFVVAQEKNEWRRIFTYEDGTVLELNTSKVTFGLGKIGRVKLRVVWAKPEKVTGMPGVEYKTRLETVEFKCTQRRFRRDEMILLDTQGKPVYSYTGKMSDEWEELRPKSLMNRVFDPACALIDEKRRKPTEESPP